MRYEDLTTDELTAFADDELGCEACGFVADHAEDLEQFHKGPPMSAMGGEEERILCNICFTTFAGNAHQYPEQYPNRDVMFLVANLTNRTWARLDKIDAKLDRVLEALNGGESAMKTAGDL